MELTEVVRLVKMVKLTPNKLFNTFKANKLFSITRTNLLKQDELLLEAFNSAVAANIGNKEFNSAVFTGLVQGIIDQSQSVYNELSKNPISGSAFNGATSGQLTNQANAVQGRANQLPNALYNAQVTLDKINALNNQVRSMPYLPQFRAGNSRATNILNGFYTKVGYKQFFGKKGISVCAIMVSFLITERAWALDPLKIM